MAFVFMGELWISFPMKALLFVKSLKQNLLCFK